MSTPKEPIDPFELGCLIDEAVTDLCEVIAYQVAIENQSFDAGVKREARASRAQLKSTAKKLALYGIHAEQNLQRRFESSENPN
jgi:hypothetical protein